MEVSGSSKRDPARENAASLREDWSSLRLEAYLADDLETEDREAVERAMATDPKLADWIRDRRSARAAFPIEPRRRSFASLAEEAGAAEDAVQRSWGWRAIAVAAGFVGVLVIGGVEMGGVGQRNGVRAKGQDSSGPIVRVVKKEAIGVSALEPGDVVHPGDRLRLMVDDTTGGYVAVLLEEESGEVNVLYTPEELGRVPAGPHRLPGSIQLDHMLGRERIYVIVSDDIPDLRVWTNQIVDAHLEKGFDHGWMPDGQVRASTLEYVKIQ